MRRRITYFPAGLALDDCLATVPPGWRTIVAEMWRVALAAGGRVTLVTDDTARLVVCVESMPADGEATMRVAALATEAGRTCVACGCRSAQMWERKGVAGTQRIVACVDHYWRWREGYTSHEAMLSTFDARTQDERDIAYEDIDWSDAGCLDFLDDDDRFV